MEYNILSRSKYCPYFSIESIRTVTGSGCKMQEMLNNASNSATRVRKLNTILEITETSEENDIHVLQDSNPKRGDLTLSVASTPCGKPSRNMATDILNTSIYRSLSERRNVFAHASPRHTLATAPSYWREKASVSITPAGVIRSSSEPSPLKPSSGQNISEVELLFPEYFKGGEMPLTAQKAETVCNELDQKKRSVHGEKASNKDPLVQSWLSLFGSQVY